MGIKEQRGSFLLESGTALWIVLSVSLLPLFDFFRLALGYHALDRASQLALRQISAVDGRALDFEGLSENAQYRWTMYTRDAQGNQKKRSTFKSSRPEWPEVCLKAGSLCEREPLLESRYPQKKFAMPNQERVKHIIEKVLRVQLSSSSVCKTDKDTDCFAFEVLLSKRSDSQGKEQPFAQLELKLHRDLPFLGPFLSGGSHRISLRKSAGAFLEQSYISREVQVYSPSGCHKYAEC